MIIGRRDRNQETYISIFFTLSYMSIWEQPLQSSQQALDPKIISLKMLTNFVVLGNIITSVKWYLKVSEGTPTGTIQCKIISSDGTTLLASSETLAMPTSGTFAYFTFSSFDADVTILANFYVLIQTTYTSGAGNAIALGVNGSSVTYTEQWKGIGGSYVTSILDDQTPTMSITYGVEPISTTRLPPPPLIARF